jgi:hypothetical protein
MKQCPYCGHSNDDQENQCRKCDAYLITRRGGTVYRQKLVGPIMARNIRRKALSFVVLGLMIKVYWGGYGPWPVYDTAPFAALRYWLEPLFMYGGAAVYVAGWLLNWI